MHNPAFRERQCRAKQRGSPLPRLSEGSLVTLLTACDPHLKAGENARCLRQPGLRATANHCIFPGLLPTVTSRRRNFSGPGGISAARQVPLPSRCRELPKASQPWGRKGAKPLSETLPPPSSLLYPLPHFQRCPPCRPQRWLPSLAVRLCLSQQPLPHIKAYPPIVLSHSQLI